mmetsp:Transcript_20914/g.51401  ORF Transcript_20914/g.51401 Transcript_20914/m.51401 type:complete len:867 (+) Transcript_20914:994-3594(+)
MGNDVDENNENGTGDTTDEGSTTSVPQEMPQTPQPKPKEDKKRETAGDRVLAKNGLAKVISAIPHLFLRDVRVRLIIRNEPPNKDDTGEPNPDDTMIEIGIDFLSVASGEDILSRFQEQTTDDDLGNSAAEDGRPLLNRRSSVASVEDTVEENEFLFRHIRTGKGPDAGIWVRVFVPEDKMSAGRLRRHQSSDARPCMWAAERWIMATDYYLLRCSGLDIRGRIYLGTKKEDVAYSWWYDDQDIEEYDELTLDSVLMGVDHIAPGPQLPLPPMQPMINRDLTPTPQKEKELEDSERPTETESVVPLSKADLFFKDRNGIQSCQIRSTFHRVSRGMIPGSAKDCQNLPSEDNSDSWIAPPGIEKDSPLDDSMPMPGLTLQLTIRDPLEINVDRSSLNAIGLVRSIFQQSGVDQNVQKTAEDNLEDSTATTDATTNNKSTENNDTFTNFGCIMPDLEKEEGQEDSTEAFTHLMQPETIQVLGLHLSEIQLRVHVMRNGDRESNHSFCYWEVETECLTVDQKKFVPSPGKNYSDLLVEIGYLSWDEYVGTERRTLVSSGFNALATRGRNDSQSYATMSIDGEDASEDQEIWPCTASVLLNIPPPHETLIFKDKQNYGVQLRLIGMSPAPAVFARSSLHGRLGVTAVDTQWSITSQVGCVMRELTKSIAPQRLTDTQETSDSEPAAGAPTTRPKTLMVYCVQVDNAIYKMEPKMNAKLPPMCVAGERSSENGLFIETIADKLRFAWGQPTPSKAKGLSLHQLAALPEDIRMRILLCLEDLQPLEKGLFLKIEKNPFKRCRNVNKGIAKLAKRMAKASRLPSMYSSLADGATTDRKDILREVLAMDEAELKEMWYFHKKQKRKLAKKRLPI